MSDELNQSQAADPQTRERLLRDIGHYMSAMAGLDQDLSELIAIYKSPTDRRAYGPKIRTKTTAHKLEALSKSLPAYVVGGRQLIVLLRLLNAFRNRVAHGSIQRDFPRGRDDEPTVWRLWIEERDSQVGERITPLDFEIHIWLIGVALSALESLHLYAMFDAHDLPFEKPLVIGDVVRLQFGPSDNDSVRGAVLDIVNRLFPGIDDPSDSDRYVG